MNIDDLLDQHSLESHPLLPSGEWVGFYCYSFDPTQQKMSTDLEFCNQKITGHGSDHEVGAFTWKGNYDLDAMKLRMTKIYRSHQVHYQGDIDENGIWGTWSLFEPNPNNVVSGYQFTGGFHIWPKQKGKNSMAAEIESAQLKKVFEQVLSV